MMNMEKNHVIMTAKIFSHPYFRKINEKQYCEWRITHYDDNSTLKRNRFICRTDLKDICQDFKEKKYHYGQSVEISGKLLLSKKNSGLYSPYIYVEKIIPLD